MSTFELYPIGFVRGGRDAVADDDWGGVVAAVELDPARFGPEALEGLDAFSHAEILFVFDRVAEADIEFGARHPRGRSDWPRVGVFAQRAKNRPNRLGLCTCTILRVEGLRLEVQGLDAVNGTPVLDIKPVMAGFLPSGPVREPDWSQDLMAAYW